MRPLHSVKYLVIAALLLSPAAAFAAKAKHSHVAPKVAKECQWHPTDDPYHSLPAKCFGK